MTDLVVAPPSMREVVRTDPAQLTELVLAQAPTASAEWLVNTRHDLVDIDARLQRTDPVSLLEARRAARVTEWHMARRWPANPDGVNREDDRPPLLASNGADRVAWQKVYAVGRADVAQLLAETDPTRLTLSRFVKADRQQHDLPEAPALVDVPTTYPTVVIDPPWRYDNVATRGAAEDHYPTMTLDELAKLEVPAADDAHVYLWVTNGFIRQGFDLLDAWGFAYKTTLTWCKPQIGMGNYFRNNTEHVLFAVRGRLPVITAVKNVGTWFVADRTDHSAKPESFYDIVERCSPGPHFEMFARRRRLGWHTWGNEA